MPDGVGPHSTRSLIEAAAAGERWAQDECYQLLQSFSRQLHGRAGKAMRAELDWEDLAQEASKRFFSVGMHQYRGKGTDKSYLYSIVKSTIIQIWRSRDRRKKREEIFSPDDPVTQSNPDAPLDVRFVLAKLDEDSRHLLERLYLDGATYSELAAELGMAESSVRAKVSRCLRRARERLA